MTADSSFFISSVGGFVKKLFPTSLIVRASIKPERIIRFDDRPRVIEESTHAFWGSFKTVTELVRGVSREIADKLVHCR